jgi:hypothetical protein
MNSHINQKTNRKEYYTPHGAFLHIPPQEQDASSNPNFKLPWWKDFQKYCIGNLTLKARKLCVINMLMKHDNTIYCCSEESLNEILGSFLKLYCHAAS